MAARRIENRIHRPEEFPASLECDSPDFGRAQKLPRSGGAFSQSERDWAFAKRALTRGEDPQLVVSAIAVRRRFDKHNPRYYAELTVRKALEDLGARPDTKPER